MGGMVRLCFFFLAARRRLSFRIITPLRILAYTDEAAAHTRLTSASYSRALIDLAGPSNCPAGTSTTNGVGTASESGCLPCEAGTFFIFRTVVLSPGTPLERLEF